MNRKMIVSFALMTAILAGCSKTDDTYKEAKKLMNDGQYLKAAEYFSQAVATNNANAAFYVDMGYNCIEINKFQTAIESFEHAISLGRNLEESYRGLGIAYYEQGLYKDAIEAFNMAIDQVELDVGIQEYDLLNYRGACERKLNNYDAALATYNALIELGIDKEKQYLYEGEIYLALNNLEKAGECFDAVLDIEDDEVELYFTIYNNYESAGYQNEGMKYLSRALEIDGNSTQAHLWRGKIYYMMRNYSAALTELAYPMEEKNHEAALYVAFCYEEMGDYEKAKVVYFEELTRKDDPEMSNYLALCLSEMGEYEMAWNIVHTAIENYPDCDCIRQLKWNEVVLYEKCGYYPSAYTRLLEYQNEYPGDPLVEEELKFLLMKQR